MLNFSLKPRLIDGEYRTTTVAKSELDRLIAERANPAVKAAFESLGAQPTRAPARRRARV
jgi:hypothetical protein